VTLHTLAAVAGLGEFALVRGFSRAYGVPPHAWLIQERIRRAQSRYTPATAATQVGFADQSHLHRHFKRVVGMTPGWYHRAVAP
jgi:AraC-like DNA-binding protein